MKLIIDKRNEIDPKLISQGRLLSPWGDFASDPDSISFYENQLVAILENNGTLLSFAMLDLQTFQIPDATQIVFTISFASECFRSKEIC